MSRTAFQIFLFTDSFLDFISYPRLRGRGWARDDSVATGIWLVCRLGETYNRRLRSICIFWCGTYRGFPAHVSFDDKTGYWVTNSRDQNHSKIAELRGHDHYQGKLVWEITDVFHVHSGLSHLWKAAVEYFPLWYGIIRALFVNKFRLYKYK